MSIDTLEVVDRNMRSSPDEKAASVSDDPALEFALTFEDRRRAGKDRILSEEEGCAFMAKLLHDLENIRAQNAKFLGRPTP